MFDNSVLVRNVRVVAFKSKLFFYSSTRPCISYRTTRRSDNYFRDPRLRAWVSNEPPYCNGSPVLVPRIKHKSVSVSSKNKDTNRSPRALIYEPTIILFVESVFVFSARSFEYPRNVFPRTRNVLESPNPEHSRSK